MNKILFLPFIALLLSGCFTTRKPEERIVIQPAIYFREIDPSFLECPAPPITEDDLVDLTEFENEYNELLTTPLFENNILCYQNMQRVIEWNNVNIENNKKIIESP